ncbi:hypothetical protein FUA23_06315 [Neolewinella aurantiaca]|uniref:Lipocalin-like domain-containing protein n=1 Tax=Neolewinella aurantiaca TaxID=2602767 RepID=A0A5C7FYX2_9BACT|nr:hypothetical protein [Neolewinella aurantiaca]TXF90401.1 hypothetical protein FUA23_06315 [Neolewinella aurantiaca]
MRNVLTYFLLLSFTSLCLSGCENESEKAFRSDLPGRWRVNDFTTSGTETTLNNDGTFSERAVTTTVTNNDLEITFTDNPASYYSEGTYTVNYVYTANEVTSSVSVEASGIGQGSWTFDDGQMEMISHQNAEVYQLDEITINEDGTIDASGTYELRRISDDQPKTAELTVSFQLSPL